jgi:hypothetical protein
MLGLELVRMCEAEWFPLCNPHMGNVREAIEEKSLIRVHRPKRCAELLNRVNGFW